MKNIDVSKKVMNDIASYERSSISVWMRYFIVTIIGIVVFCIGIFLMIANDLLSKSAFDVFELFSQDPEIISEFWKEVLTTFWDEIPQHLMLIAFVLISVLIIVVYKTGKKRQVIRKKLKELEKYS
jgi:H+/Cl- antiporter ClcA